MPVSRSSSSVSTESFHSAQDEEEDTASVSKSVVPFVQQQRPQSSSASPERAPTVSSVVSPRRAASMNSTEPKGISPAHHGPSSDDASAPDHGASTASQPATAEVTSAEATTTSSPPTASALPASSPINRSWSTSDEEDESFESNFVNEPDGLAKPNLPLPRPKRPRRTSLKTRRRHSQQQKRNAPNGSDDEDDEDTVTGNWSLDEDEVPDVNLKQRHPRPKASTISTITAPKNSMTMSAGDIEICQRLDEEYDKALEEREIAFSARYNSVRQSACFAVGFMIIYLALGTVFFLRQAGWDIPQSLFFSIYTITTVGYGSLENPKTPLFQLYTIFFIFIGIATLTIMVAQVYQCLALEASRAQHARDQSEMARRGLDTIMKTDDNNQAAAMAAPVAAMLGEIHQDIPWMDRVLAYWERTRAFFRDTEIGRGLSVLFPFAGLILVGAAVIGPLEGWTPVESLYFSVVSMTTVGLGDYYPTRTASIWFCIFWLPFSIGFMSLYLAHVATFYIRLSDKNIARIERILRRRVAQAKESAEKEREAALRRAMRGQEQYAASIEMGDVDSGLSPGHRDRSGSTDGSDDDISGTRRLHVKRRRGFDTVPLDDDPESSSAAGLRQRRSSRHLFGSPDPEGASQGRRERILMNSNFGLHQKDDGDDESALQGSTMTTMKDILRTVHHNIAGEKGSSLVFRSGPESEFLSIRSTNVMQNHSLRHDPVRKPSFALRVLVQERFSEIIATDIAGYQSNIEIKENTLSVTIDTLKETADKWLVPRRARKAFRAVAFEALYFVGEHGLITRGAEALYDLSPFEFHGLFSPLLAALGDAETMEGWLASTKVLAEVDLRRDPSRPSLADQSDGRRRPTGKRAERLETAQNRSVTVSAGAVKAGVRVTQGNALANR